MQTSNPIIAHFTIAGQKLPVSHFNLTESISAPVELSVTLRLSAPFDQGAWLGQPVSLRLSDDHAVNRVWHLRCETAQLQEVGGAYSALLTCRSQWGGSFYGQQSMRVYCHQSLPELVETLLGEQVFCQWHLSHEAWMRDQLVQCAESDAEFIQRICGRENIQWFTRYDDQKEVLHFVNHPQFFIDREKALIYSPRNTFQNGPGSKLGIYQLTAYTRNVLDATEWQEDSAMRLYSGVPCFEAGQRTAGMPVKSYQPLSYDQHKLEEVLRSRHVKQRDLPKEGYGALRFESNHLDLAPGMRAEVALHGVYRINYVQHFARTTSEGEMLLYHNAVIAQDNASPWRGVMNPMPSIPLVFQAQIKTKGRESLGVASDTSDNVMPIPRLTPYANNQGGMQFHMYPGVEVLLTCLHGELDLPVIIGSVFNDEHPSPVTASNPYINILRTQQNQTLIFDDTPAVPLISLTTQSGHQWVMRNGDAPGIFVECVGGMILSSMGKQNWYTGQDFKLWAGQTYVQKASVGQLIQSEQGSIQFESKLNLKLHALRQIELYAKRHQQLFCRNQNISVMNNQTITLEKGDASVHVQGATQVEVAHNITISSLSGDIVLRSQAGNCGMTLTQSGDITVYGKLIKINSKIQKHAATIDHH